MLSRVSKNTIILIGSNASSAALGFLIAIVIARAWGAPGLGEYSLVLAWTFALGIAAEFGLNTLVTREVAQTSARADDYLIDSTIAKIALALPLAGALMLAAPILARDADTIAALRLGAWLIPLNALYGSFTAIFRGLERMTPIFILNTAGLVAQLAGTVVIAANQQGVLAIIAWGIAVQAAQLAAAFFYLRRWGLLRGWIRFAHHMVYTDPERSEGGCARNDIPHPGFSAFLRVQKLFRPALPFALAGILSAIEMRLPLFLLGAFQGEVTTGIYSAAARLPEAARLIPNAFFGALFPALAALSGYTSSRNLSEKGGRAARPEPFLRQDKLRRRIPAPDAQHGWATTPSKTTSNILPPARRRIFVYALASALVLIALAQPLLAFFYGADFGEAYLPFILLAVALIPNLLNALTLVVLYARGEEHSANRMQFGALVVQFLFSLPLIYLGSAVGAAISVLFGDMLLFALLRGRASLDFRARIAKAFKYFLGSPRFIAAGIFVAALAFRLAAKSSFQFDGLYGQDAFAYLDYSRALGSALAQFQIPPPFFWPLGYPALVALASIFVSIETGAQMVSLIAGALTASLTFLLTQEILRDHPRVLAAGIIAGLMVASAGQFLISSISAMSDAAGLFWALMSAYAFARFARADSPRWIAVAGLALGCAIMTRWTFGLLAPVWIAALVAENKNWRKAITRIMRFILPLIAALASQIALMLIHAARGTSAYLGDIQTVSWNLTNAWSNEITNGDGHFIYALPVAAFYAQTLAHPSFIFPSLTPFILIGAWALRRARCFLILLGGWILAIWFFLAGIAWENPRFALAFLPPLAILAAIGVTRFVDRVPHARRWTYALVGASLALTFVIGFRGAQEFVAAQQLDRAIARWAIHKLPPHATVITFGITQTLKHFTAFDVIELYDETPESVCAIAETRDDVFVLVNPANLETQWRGFAPQINFDALRARGRFEPIAQSGAYTLFARP
ncbi:MAG: oligosaccharide flippase family protein [Chloroflexi bacterium]|nr:oligosaccharide flippase family protein [Chloroflexota bacterium]